MGDLERSWSDAAFATDLRRERRRSARLTLSLSLSLSRSRSRGEEAEHRWTSTASRTAGVWLAFVVTTRSRQNPNIEENLPLHAPPPGAGAGGELWGRSVAERQFPKRDHVCVQGLCISNNPLPQSSCVFPHLLSAIAPAHLLRQKMQSWQGPVGTHLCRIPRKDMQHVAGTKSDWTAASFDSWPNGPHTMHALAKGPRPIGRGGRPTGRVTGVKRDNECRVAPVPWLPFSLSLTCSFKLNRLEVNTR